MVGTFTKFGLLAGVLAGALLLAAPAVAQPRLSIGVYGRHGGVFLDTGRHYYGHHHHGWHTYGPVYRGYHYYPAHRYYDDGYYVRPSYRYRGDYYYDNCW